MELPTHLEVTPVWREIRAELQRKVGQSAYEIWLEPLQAESLRGSVLLLKAPPAIEAWVSKRFLRVLEGCARAVLGPDVTVAFVGERAHDDRPARSAEPPSAIETLNPRYSFEQFIIGKGNHLAHAASLAVAENPGQAYNPLFLRAPPGLGKTHLVHAIGNYVMAFSAGATVRYTTVEAFTNHFITALTSRSLERFKQAYRDADVLLIDDVQFLASKAKTEEEFFHTFNALYETGRQVVLTCDRLPRQLLAIEERLRERFESGLVAEIEPPDFATRVAILRKRAALDGVPLADPDVLELIAQRVSTNVRLLEGALIRIVAYHSLTGRPIDLELAATVLEDLYPGAGASAPTVTEVQAEVAAYYGLTVEELTSPSRAARVAWPRQVAIHLTRQLTDTSLGAIGNAFGGRNHATVLHACRKVADRLAGDQQAALDVDEVASRLRAIRGDRDC